MTWDDFPELTENGANRTTGYQDFAGIIAIYTFRDDVHMTSALRGREGVSRILTKGREVA